MTPHQRLNTLQREALDAYNAETFAGGEPVYPQLAADTRDILEENSRLKMQLANTLRDVAEIEREKV